MTITLAQNAARVSYSVSEGATQTSFTVSFEFFDDADLNVYVDGTLKTISTHYTVSGGSGSTGAVAISVTGATGGSTVVITRDIALARTTDFPTSGSFQIATLNTELDRFTAIAADLKDSSNRSLQLTDFDTAVSLVLPDVNSRKGTVLGFNASTGAVEAGPNITAVQSLADVTTSISLLGTSDAVSDMNTLATATIVNNISTVAGISSNVSTLAGIASNVTTVANDATDIGAVAGKATEIGRLGTSDAVADLAVLGTADVVSDMNTLGSAAIVEDMNLLGTSANVTAMGVLGTSANVTAMAALAGSSSVEIPALTVKAGDGADGNFFLIADNSDDNGDDWLIAAKHDPLKTLQITNNFGTSGGVMLTLTNSTNLTSESTAAFAGTVEVGNSVKFENSVNGSYTGSVSVKSAATSSSARTITLPDLDGTVALTSQLSGPAFQLPTAAASTLGGIKVGTNLSIDGSGVLSSTNTTDLVSDTSPQLGGALDVNGQDIVSTSNGAIELDPNGSGKVTFKGNSTRGAGQFVLNCEQNSHGIIVKGPPHSAGASYTLTLPNTNGSANEVLKTDGSGNLDWVAQTTDTNTTYSVGDGGLTQNNFTNTLKSKLDGIAASANNYVHPNHSGEVTSTADGATVIADNVVDEANLKVSNSPTNGYFLSAQSGNTGGLTWSEAGGGADLYAANESSPSAQPSATGANAVAIGDSSVSSGADSLAFGDGATASSTRSTAIGYNATSSSVNSTAIGPNATSSNFYTVAIGSPSNGTGSVATGAFSAIAINGYASGTDSFAAGVGSNSSSYGASATDSLSMSKVSKANAQRAIAIGRYAVASATGAVSIGESNVASAANSSAYGVDAKASIIGQTARASGYFAADGDAQGSTFILRSDTTDATAEALTTNNSTAGSTNQIVAASDTCITFSGTIVAMQNGAQSYGSWEIKGLLVNDGGTTTLANSAITVIQNASSWGLALSADNTNNALKIQVTGEASHNIRWVANVQTSEVTFA